jgi:hypothetical protein
MMNYNGLCTTALKHLHLAFESVMLKSTFNSLRAVIMKKIYRVLSVAILTTSLFALSSSPVLACGPSFIVPIFAMDARPENFAQFANGNVGIVHPTLNRSALFVAYRVFNNLPFSAKEQQDLVRNWQAEYENTDINEATKNTAINNWIAARKKIAGNEPEPKIYADRTNPDSYSSFYNCTAGAFDNAVKTLEARLTKTKADDANIKAWLQGQDQVFANCSEAKELPSAVAADAPDWLKADRDYQIAAAQFYATNYEAAKADFEKIAANANSPWHETAAYLLARVAIRQASAISEDTAQRDKMLAYYQQAETQLNKILADTSLASVQGAAKQLLNLINFRLHPETLQQQLAKKLLDGSENPTLFQDVTDYRRLLDKAAIIEDEYISNEEKSAAKTTNSQFRQAAELTDWIFTVQSKESEAFKHAVEKWQATKNTAWLVASLMKAPADSSGAANLIAASKSLDKNSAAFLTANYHAIRLQTTLGQTDDARKTLDTLLKERGAMNASAVNQFLAERLTLAQDLDEFVKFSQRHAVQFAYDESEVQLVDVSTAPKDSEDDYTKNERRWLKRTMFDSDAATIMNSQMPISVLKDLALHPDLPDYLKASVALSAWVRAVLLSDEKIAQQLAPELAKLIPELKNQLTNYSQATNKTKNYEAVFIMLKHPAMRPWVDQGTGRQASFSGIENYRDNWWCDNTEYMVYRNDASRDSTAAVFPALLLLSKEEVEQAKAENAKIRKLAASGSNFLAEKTTEWASVVPKEKRLPEALALAVRATRYGCQNCDTGKVSKAAFDLLKNRFANSDWKKKTPYWFKDEGCEAK